jgi:hypothetical protein
MKKPIAATDFGSLTRDRDGIRNEDSYEIHHDHGPRLSALGQRKQRAKTKWPKQCAGREAAHKEMPPPKTTGPRF